MYSNQDLTAVHHQCQADLPRDASLVRWSGQIWLRMNPPVGRKIGSSSTFRSLG